MRPPGLMAAAIECLDAFLERPRPIPQLVTAWGTRHRFAGGGDRRRIAAFCFDALRVLEPARAFYASTNEIALDGRKLVLFALVREHLSGYASQDWRPLFAGEDHGPAALTEAEEALLSAARDFEPEGFAAANLPDVFIPRFKARFAHEAVGEAAALNDPAPVDLRVNALKATRDKLLPQFEATLDGRFEVLPLPDAIRFWPASEKARRALGAHPAYERGAVEIQDLGSQVAAAALKAEPGHQVLDLCAGAGGKTLALGAAMGNRGQIYACDTEGAKLAELQRRAKRAGLHTVQTLTVSGDLASNEKVDAMTERFDRVLIDAPCSGSGTWRRHPDLRWRTGAAWQAELQALQAQLLERAWPLLKPGGLLLYVTCSLFDEENDRHFSNGEGRKTQFAPDNGENEPSALDILPEFPCHNTAHGVLLTPAKSGCDGFYLSRWRKSA